MMILSYIFERKDINTSMDFNRKNVEFYKKIDKETVEKYIEYFQDSFLIKEARRYDLKGREEIGAQKEILFYRYRP